MPQVLMPALSPTMEEGKLAKWLKKAGEPVKSGDVIAEIETDKATMEVEAVDEGPLTAILVPEGTENVKVNTPIAVIGDGAASETPTSKPPAKESPASAKSERVEGPHEPAHEKKIAEPAVKGPVPEPEPEVPAGTEMVAMTVREALRAAMIEEMRRDDRVFLMGEEVGQY